MATPELARLQQHFRNIGLSNGGGDQTSSYQSNTNINNSFGAGGSGIGTPRQQYSEYADHGAMGNVSSYSTTDQKTNNGGRLYALADVLNTSPSVFNRAVGLDTNQNHQQNQMRNTNGISEGFPMNQQRNEVVEFEEETKNTIRKMIFQLESLRQNTNTRMSKARQSLLDLDPHVVVNNANAMNANQTLSNLITEAKLSVSLKEIQTLEPLRVPSISAEPFGSLLETFAICIQDDALNADIVTHSLHDSDSRVKVLQVAVDQNDIWRDQALNGEENISAGEHHYKQLISMLDELMQIVHHRIALTTGEGHQSVVMKKFENAYSTLELEVRRHLDANAQLKGRLENDVVAVEEKSQQQQKDDELKDREFNQRRSEEFAALDNNERKQSEAWQKVLESLEVLQKLSMDRSSLVSSLIEGKEAEARRKYGSTTMLEGCQRHKQVLRQILRELDQFDKLFEEVRRTGEDAKKRLDVRIQDMDRILRDVRLDEQKNHLSVFRRYSMTLGDYLYRRDKRMSDIVRSMRHLELSREVARDVLDRNGERYLSDLSLLQREKQAIADEMEILRKKMDHAIELFRPTEAALVAANIEFVHPTQQLTETLSRREIEQRQVRKKYEEGSIPNTASPSLPQSMPPPQNLDVGSGGYSSSNYL